MIILSITLIFLFLVGVSYAWWSSITRQKEINVLETRCIKVEMEELTNAINLIDARPLIDKEGERTKPFRFKLTNICDVNVTYNLNLEVMERENRMASHNIAVKVDDLEKSILTENPKAKVTYKESDYRGVESYTLYSGELRAKESVEHNLRAWMDESADNESQNKEFYSKVVIDASQKPNSIYEDIELAVLLDGNTSEDFPSQDSNYKYVGYECNNEASISWDYAKWAPIVENLTKKGTACTIKFTTGTSISNVQVGDYISYTPTKTNYTVTGNLTGCLGSGSYPCPTTNQTLYPSELNLWRVLKKNADGTVEIVSEYVSSQSIYFYGKKGYEQLVGSLSRIAEQYETEGITVGSRPMGYNGQTHGVIMSNATTAEWTDHSDSTNSPNGSQRERTGGGDGGHITDYNLVKEAIGTAIANKVGTTSASEYWLASRFYVYDTTYRYTFAGRTVQTNGNVGFNNLIIYSGSWIEQSMSFPIRPIIILNPNLQVVEEIVNNKKTWIVN